MSCINIGGLITVGCSSNNEIKVNLDTTTQNISNIVQSNTASTSTNVANYQALNV